MLGIPCRCIHWNRLKKNSSDIICLNHAVIDHDGCVTNGTGCDAAAISLGRRRALLIEAKSGRISESGATHAIRQLRDCLDYYRHKLKGFDIIPVLLKEKRKRLESFVREKKLRREARKRLTTGVQVEESGQDISFLL